ncbi:MAG TPA: oligogalacturonate lyase family protein [Bryobacteraceae bacterium]|jgi:oligogalacturonide lyase|nr:oligogalacturonate lyase family protein [Bryobacteraceae bacterium]
MAVWSRHVSRRSFVASTFLATRALANDVKTQKGEVYESEWNRYSDVVTEFTVYRLTEPSYSSTLPAAYNRVISRNSNLLLYSCDRNGSPQAFRMNLKSGETQQLTDRKAVDARSLALLPDSRSFCYFGERTMYLVSLANLKERAIYTVPEDWDASPGWNVSADGAHATFVERRGEGSRLRSVSLMTGATRTILESSLVVADPMERPLRAQLLYRKPGQGMSLVNSDGQENRELKLALGGVGPAYWGADGKAFLYLNFPEDHTQLNGIREYTVDQDTDKLVAPTSQYAHFGANRDHSVFVGASRNAASPVILLMLRVTRRELTLCEHRSSHPDTVAPMFAPDAQRIYFQSDMHGKPALYSVHVERLVEKIEGDSQ